MIRLTATRPEVYDLAQLYSEASTAAPGCIAVNEVAPDLIAAYWADSDAPTSKLWEQVVAGHVPAAADIDSEHSSDDPLAAEVARLSSLLEAVLADPEIAKVADIEAIRTAAEGSKGDDALVLAVAKVLAADPAEVRKKRDENPQWFADVVAKYGLGGGKADGAAPGEGLSA